MSSAEDMPPEYRAAPKAAYRVLRKSGQLPNDLLGTIAPDPWAKNTLEKLGKIVGNTPEGKLPDLLQWLRDTVEASESPAVTPRTLINAERWLIEQMATRRSSRGEPGQEQEQVDEQEDGQEQGHGLEEEHEHVEDSGF
jgi:hypothetical protein